MQCSSVDDMKKVSSVSLVPKRHEDPPGTKFLPKMVISEPPVDEPSVGEIRSMVGVPRNENCRPREDEPSSDTRTKSTTPVSCEGKAQNRAVVVRNCAVDTDEPKAHFIPVLEKRVPNTVTREWPLSKPKLGTRPCTITPER
jgi:hypothetical protein